MGVYLSTAHTEKFSSDQSVGNVTYGASSMQGWRKSQEDAHNCCPNFDEDTKTLLFAVYDGHGGAEVAEFASRHLPDVIKQNELYKKGNLTEALVDSFLSFDASLIEEKAQKEIISIAQLDKVESADEDEAEMLNEEAEMPIEDVLENYGGVQQLPEDVKNVFNKNKKFQKNSNQIYESPALRPKCNGSGQGDGEVTSKTNLDTKLANGHLDENENGKCSKVESTTPDEAEKATEEKTEEAVSSSDDVVTSDVNGDNEATPVEKAKPKPARTAEDKEERKGESAEPSSSNLPNEVEDEEEDDEDDDEEEEEEDWSDTSSDGEEDAEDGCCHGHEDAEMMAQLNDEDKPGYDSGCTAVVALLRDRVLYVANAGDSRCVLCRAGKAVDMSIDHKPEDELELARIKRAGGLVSLDGRVNGGLNLSRALGDHVYKTNDELELKDQMISGLPDIQTTQLKDDDEFMIIACDGIWNSMTSQEVVDFVKERTDNGVEKMSRICEDLFDHCLSPDTAGDGTGCDNMTAIIVRFHHGGGSGDATSAKGVKRSAADSAETNEADVSSSKRAKVAKDYEEPESTEPSTG